MPKVNRHFSKGRYANLVKKRRLLQPAEVMENNVIHSQVNKNVIDVASFGLSLNISGGTIDITSLLSRLKGNRELKITEIEKQFLEISRKMTLLSMVEVDGFEETYLVSSPLEQKYLESIRGFDKVTRHKEYDKLDRSLPFFV